MPSTSILLADGHQRLAAILASLLDDEHDLRVVGITRTASDTLVVSARMRPDVVLLDGRLPGGSPGSVVTGLRATVPDAAVLVWSHEPRLTAQQLDVDGILERGCTFREVVREIRRTRRHVTASWPPREGQLPPVPREPG